ncbi:glutamate--cysteine ligase [Streptomyces sp. NPDC088745]|uniref:glutamate--cysteine ligase n=1 Tax=Streptomyces sp. NPDC088745 TaxID=3365884 RepID=UPI0038073F3F
MTGNQSTNPPRRPPPSPGPTPRVAADQGRNSTSRTRLRACLTELEDVLHRPGFGTASTTLGAELELFLVHTDGSPALLGDAVRTAVADKRIAPEVNRFLLEVNVTPVRAAGGPFRTMAAESDEVLAKIAHAASTYAAAPVTLGSLPTLTSADVGPSALSPHPRYRALERAFTTGRALPFAFTLDGAEPTTVHARSVAVQGLSCSWQVHLSVAPQTFTRTYNAAQLAIAPVLAAACNSSLMLGRRSWQEARIPMFEHGFGDRSHDARRPPRVAFGPSGRWLAGGVRQLFEEAVRHYDVLEPVVSDVLPCPDVTDSGVPSLRELRDHMSTVWWWNRPVYDPSGHVRIEFRALPSGPTTIDMAANAAFLVGLTTGLAEQADVAELLPFAHAQENFYLAAKYGLDAQLWWPSSVGAPPTRRRAADLVCGLVPLAAAGLASLEVDKEETESLLEIIRARATTGRTGATWQDRTLMAFEQHVDRAEALRMLTRAYADLARTGAPVHTWPVRAHRGSSPRASP